MNRPWLLRWSSRLMPGEWYERDFVFEDDRDRVAESRSQDGMVVQTCNPGEDWKAYKP